MLCRTDVLVISATISVAKIPLEKGDDVRQGIEGDPWPLEVVDFVRASPPPPLLRSTRTSAC